MPIQGFQPDASVFTAFWRYQEIKGGNVTNEFYVNFGLVKWFTTNRGAIPPVGAVLNQIQFWFNPKEQNEDPDLVLKDTPTSKPATSMLNDLDAIWLNAGSTTGFQPESAIDTAFWRYQYTNPLGVITNEIYLNMGAIKWMKTLRIPSPQPSGRTDQVSLWFNNKDQDYNPDLTLDDGPSAKLLSDFDAIWSN
jgi:hypothetical protein